MCPRKTAGVLLLSAGVGFLTLSGCASPKEMVLFQYQASRQIENIKEARQLTKAQIDRQTETLEQRMARLESASQEAVKPVREVQQWTIGGLVALVAGVLWRAVKARGMLAMLQDIQEGLKGINMRG